LDKESGHLKQTIQKSEDNAGITEALWVNHPQKYGKNENNEKKIQRRVWGKLMQTRALSLVVGARTRRGQESSQAATRKEGKLPAKRRTLRVSLQKRQRGHVSKKKPKGV